MEPLAGRYVLEERLGSGGTATVWRATDTSLGVVRAIKLLDVAHGPEREALRERLRREAQAMAQLTHPNIVSIRDVGVDGDRDFIVMDLIDGPSLADWLDDNGPMSADAAVRMGVQVLDALGLAHKRGLVHRDVKPGNVLMDAAGDAHLCDFGIALAEASDDRHTKTGVALGSLPYMAPEQRRDARSVGPTADLYALGCTLYHALTCATPVDLYLAPGRSPRWAAVPAALVEVLRRATSAAATDRYPDAESMGRALVLAMAPSEAEPEIEAEPISEVAPPRRSGRPMLLANVALVIVFVAVSWLLVQELQRGRLARGQDAPVPVAELVPEGFEIAGRWTGPWARQSPGIEVEIHGPDDALEGTVLVHFGTRGGNTRQSLVDGHWDRRTATLFLSDRQKQPGHGVYEATLDAQGFLKGDFRRSVGGDPVSFVLVRVD